MKRIKKLEKMFAGEVSRNDVLVCTEFIQAYEQSADFDTMNVDSIFTHNVPAFMAECLVDGIKEITISDTSSGMITTLSAFNDYGCVCGGFTKVFIYGMKRDAIKMILPTNEIFAKAMEKKLAEAIADTEPDAEFYDERAKVISRKEALQMAYAADWENAWERKLF